MNDCLLAIWENIHSYDPKRSSFKNWIGGIAKYKSIDYTRKYLKDLENENIEDVIIPTEDNSIKEILKSEIREETEKCSAVYLKRIEIFQKLYFEDKDMNEISKDTGLSNPFFITGFLEVKEYAKKLM